MGERGDRARRSLIEAAEQLFAERGIESVSLRDISTAAGQRNHSAAQYHFGDRAGLVAAVYDHRMTEVNARRHALLDDLEASDRSEDLGRLVDATIRPLIDVVAETDGWYARFIVRARWDAFAHQVLNDVPALSSLRRAFELIEAHLDGPRSARLDRLDQMTTLFVGTIAGWESRRHSGLPVPSPTALSTDLTATCRAVLTARTTVPELTRSNR